MREKPALRAPLQGTFRPPSRGGSLCSRTPPPEQRLLLDRAVGAEFRALTLSSSEQTVGLLVYSEAPLTYLEKRNETIQKALQRSRAARGL